MKYLYKAKNSKGQIITGSVRGETEVDAEKILIDHNLAVIDLSPEKQSFSLGNIFHKNVSVREKSLFSRQLATMVSAGLELPRAIKVVGAQAVNEKTKSVFLSIYKDVDEGNSFSVALSKHPDVFDPVYISIVKAGESTGKLDTVLKQLADQLESDNNFVSKVKGALYYPCFILIALILIGSYMLIKVIPALKGIFESSGQKLPSATRFLIGLSGFVQSYWWVILIVIIFLAAFGSFWLKSASGEELKFKFQTKTPGIKKLFEGIYMYRFSKVLSMLIGAGVPLLDSLKIASAVLNNNIYEESIAKVISQVQKGVPLSVQLSKDPIFPSLLGQMTAVGEETGQLDVVLAKIADYYSDSTDQMVKAISTMVEPVVLLLMGFGVAFLVFAILVPIYNIAQLQ